MELRQVSRAAGAGRRPASKARHAPFSRRRLSTAAVLLCALFADGPAWADPGAFTGLAGTWSGSGTVALEDGSTERIRCRANYAVAGPRMGLVLTCASDAYKFGLQADVVAEGSAISGSWSETSRGVSGVLQGCGGGGNFQLVATTAGFNANIALATRGNKQSVSIRADSQFRAATISLSR